MPRSLLPRASVPIGVLALLLTALPARAQATFADRVDDLRRAAAVRAALAEDAQTRRYDVGVAAEGGVVVLTGVVGSAAARERAEALARAVRGVRAVQNGLRLDGEPVAEPRAAPAPVAGEGPPAAEPVRSEVAPETPAPSDPGPVYHTVRRGDTLYSIARRYGTSVPALQRLNGLRTTDIRIGQRLRVR